jgi:hypothetical protein
VCERGVTAHDELQGDLTAEVTVCRAPPSQGGWALNFAEHGLTACGVDTASPGRYTIEFQVENDAGMEVGVSREVLVEDLCLGTERLCESLLCSQDGVCIDELLSVVRRMTTHVFHSAVLICQSDEYVCIYVTLSAARMYSV